MHIYFIGIGGTGIGPLAIIAREVGFEISGSDSKESEYTHYLEKKGVLVTYDQSSNAMRHIHSERPIDWVVSVSSITRNNPDHQELVFARGNGIRITERDACLNEILASNNLKMIAAAGTHGKTTSTAMLVWLFQNLNIPISYSIGAKTSFAEMGHYEPGSEYFIYECDEFHRNFLHFNPRLSIISGITWDHHEVFKTREEYKQAFREFFDQNEKIIMWDNDAEYVGVKQSDIITIEDSSEENIEKLDTPGHYNRRNAWLAILAVHELTGEPIGKLMDIISRFPGSQRRMEEIAPNIFSDYAHTPEKIIGCMSVAMEVAKQKNREIVVVYEPLTNRRQHFMKDDYKNCFDGARHVIWIPSYLSREDTSQRVLTPAELIAHLEKPEIASPAEMNDKLWTDIIDSVRDDCIVVCMSGGGGDSLDEWLRSKVTDQAQNR